MARFREPVSGLTHLTAAVFAAAGLVALVAVGWGNIAKTIALSIYGATLLVLFSASASYHLVRARPSGLSVLRKLDHAAIYLLIAGTYTPFCVLAFEGFWRWGFLAVVWSLALIGVLTKLLMMGAPRWLSTGLYLILGWLSMAAVGEMLRVLPAGALAWLLAGGVIYSLGAVIYIFKAFDLWPGRFGFHEIWHIFVILGALAHFIAVVAYVAPLA